MQLFEKQLDGFIEYLTVLKRSSDTIRSYRYSLKTFIPFLESEGIYDLKEIDSGTIRKYQERLMEKRDDPLSIETIHLLLRGLRRFFEYLKKTNQILCDPTETLIMPKLGGRLPGNILTKEEVTRIMAQADTSKPMGVRDKAMLELLYSTGARRGECARLTIHDVDYEGGYVRIRGGKGKKDRIQPLGTHACRWMKEYMLKVRPKLLDRNKADKRDDTLFLTRSGRRMPEGSASKVIEKYAKKAGIARHVSPHSFRKAFATHMLEEGAHPLYIQRLLGHSTGHILNRYIRVLARDLKKEHARTHPREKDKK